MSLLTTRTLSLAVADEISSLVVKAALANDFNPISVCILDNAGNEIVTKRMDACPVSTALALFILYPQAGNRKVSVRSLHFFTHTINKQLSLLLKGRCLPQNILC